MNTTSVTRGEIVIVTGPPGAGKTTAARLVADAQSPSVHLHADDFWDYIRGGRIEPWLPESKHQNEVVMRVVARAATGYALGGYRVVVDGIVGPWFIGEFRERADAADVPLHYFVLRPEESIAVDRATSRSAPALVAAEPVRQMYAAFGELGEYEAFVIDNGAQSPAVTAALIMDQVGAGSHRLDLR